jgi:chromosome segregation ATPase
VNVSDKTAKLVARINDAERRLRASEERAEALASDKKALSAQVATLQQQHNEYIGAIDRLGDGNKDLQRRLAEAEHELAMLRGGPKAERPKASEPQPQRSAGRLW